VLEEDAVVIDDVLQGLKVFALVAFLFVDLESFGHTALDCAVKKCPTQDTSMMSIEFEPWAAGVRWCAY